MITAAEARRQFDRAKRLGWLPMFEATAARYPWLEASDLMAIGSRETNLDPKYLRVSGDHGNGFSIMQIDKRYFPAWVAAGGWRDAGQSIDKGADVLAQKRAEIVARKGQDTSWRTSKGQRMNFVGATFNDEQLRQISFAAYNSGLAAYHHFSRSGNPDAGTTGKDYSADVIARTKLFAKLLKHYRDEMPEPVVLADSEPDDPEEVAEVAEVPATAPSTTIENAGAVNVTAAAAVSTDPPIPVEGGSVNDPPQAVTNGSGSWIRSVMTWIAGLFTAASEHVEKALGLSPDVQKYLVVAVMLVGAVYLVLKGIAEWQVRRIAADPSKVNVK